jgi:cellulose synthase/poly-beta-1,6-N-acetylglucosamine synthase-like glycosyltransferase
MGPETDHLGSFHVLYRRAALETVGGFDESRYNGPRRAAAEDLELSLRLRAAGLRLAFDRDSRVGHHHPTSLRHYLRAQMFHGFYATRVYLDHPGQRGRSRYSGWTDHAQPPLALLTAAAALAAPWSRPLALAALLGVAGLAGLGLPMAWRVARRHPAAGALFAGLSPLRAAARALGLAAALVSSSWTGRRR